MSQTSIMVFVHSPIIAMASNKISTSLSVINRLSQLHPKKNPSERQTDCTSELRGKKQSRIAFWIAPTESDTSDKKTLIFMGWWTTVSYASFNKFLLWANSRILILATEMFFLRLANLEKSEGNLGHGNHQNLWVFSPPVGYIHRIINPLRSVK